MEQNTLFNLATRVINHTQQHLFLTGNAGTGKTTFLRHIQKTTDKHTVIVAPTGVAAINAGGVTMHSFFQLPFGLYLPEGGKGWNDSYTAAGNVTNKHTLFKNIRFNKDKITLLRELELLIIDEVSMLRADALDAIDTILRHFRRQPRAPFGGVQVLYIGDLFQLPPVLTNMEASLFFEHYKSPFFFDALVMQEAMPLVIELKKIYRQSDAAFIRILNGIRNNDITHEDVEELHARYLPHVSADEGCITLTTHNSKADVINKEKLEALPGRTWKFEAEVSGDFNPNVSPADREMQLKPGAQVMFIKNDTGEVRRYYNGKIATVKSINEDGEIWVRLQGSDELLKLEQHTWKNIRYQYNQDTDEIEEEEMGAFKQFPIRLAWAITIHKSQGLTFERAVVDAGQSFAAGQVYVALSRLTSLQGLILHSKIARQGIAMPEIVIEFCRRQLREDALEEIIERDEQEFAYRQLISWFSLHKLRDNISLFNESYQGRTIPQLAEAIIWSRGLYAAAADLEQTATRFRSQLESFLANIHVTGFGPVSERIAAAVQWFEQMLERKILTPLSEHHTEWRVKPRTKKYLAELSELEAIALHLKRGWKQAVTLSAGLAEGRPPGKIDFAVEKESSRLTVPPIEGESASGGKAVKGSSALLSLQMFREGKTVQDIARERTMAPTTIEGHLAEAVQRGELDIEQFVSPEKLALIQRVAGNRLGSMPLSELKDMLPADVSFGELRAVISHAQRKSAVNN